MKCEARAASERIFTKIQRRDQVREPVGALWLKNLV